MSERKPFLPPRWFKRAAWKIHRGIYRLTGARRGLWKPKPDGWGTARLTATGRRSGEPRSVMIGYFEDGPNIVTMAMNGWDEGEPLWWLNLQADPDATIETKSDTWPVTAHAAEGDERQRLWERWREIDKNLDGYASRRSGETAVVVLEPRG